MAKKTKTILSIIGARPNFVKILPVIKQLNKQNLFRSILVHTGQHYNKEMSHFFFKDLSLPKPDISLRVGSNSHAAQTAKIMVKLEKVINQIHPHLVIVVGDVNSTLAGSLVASKLQIPIAHVEAGLRSFDKTMPEEINRHFTDSVSDLLFTPSKDANENLKREGIPNEKIFFVGNVMIDTLMEFNGLLDRQGILLDKFDLQKKEYAVVTLHRPSNVDTSTDLKRIFSALYEIQKKIKMIFPVHPRTQFYIQKYNLQKQINKMKNIIWIPPLGYLDFLALMKQALFVITDSGGIQEETTVLNIPCLTVRKNTERPVTVREGTNIVVGVDPAVIVKKSFQILDGKEKRGMVPTLWDGRASQRIVKVLSDKGMLL